MFSCRKPPAASRRLWHGAIGAALLSAAGPAQDATPESQPSVDVGAAILDWVATFEAGTLVLSDPVRVAAHSRRDFVRLGVRAGALTEVKLGDNRLSNFAVLQQLVASAEQKPSIDSTDALLALASIGLATDMFDHEIATVRELGEFALLRIRDPIVWDHVRAVATGASTRVTHDPTPAADGTSEDDAELEIGTRGMWRVAAMRLLGMKRLGVFRTSIEQCLAHRDGRMRLAAAEALRELHDAESLPAVTRVLSAEVHPMVALALLETMHHILDLHMDVLDPERTNLALRIALSRLGHVDWRSDITIVRLMQRYPLVEAVQPMIALMNNARGRPDPILKIINAKASLLLSNEAHRALRRITGALIGEDPNAWQQFWDTEKDRVVVKRPRRDEPGATTATATAASSFYGIPVLGGNVVFVLDTSGSMKEEVDPSNLGPVTGPTAAEANWRHGSRLRVACQQTLKAVQGMPDRAVFSIVTFHSDVHAWNRTPVPAGRSARATAAGILDGLRARGGTNVFDALLHVLAARDVGYGEVPESAVDEIFLLSDGEPTVGELTDPEQILAAVREVNRARRARINTVFVGSGASAEFMRRLAAENGGVFVQQ